MSLLSEIDRVEVTVLVDNVIDGSTTIGRDDVLGPYEWSKTSRTTDRYLQATHGFSALVDAIKKGDRTRVLYDTGSSPGVLQNNLLALGISVDSIDEIAISHGHWDHYGGLLWVLNKKKDEVPIYLHENMLYKKGVRLKDGIREIGQLPMLQELEDAGGLPILHTEPKIIANGKLLLCGEIPRMTSFETGFPNHIALKDGSWVDDSLIIDDRCLVGKIKGKGIVIVSGCSHAGIINMINESMRLSGCESVYAVLGGLHLVGKDSKSKTVKTIQELKEINPQIIAPGHCTGWKAIHAISQELPKAFIGLSVGNRYVL